MRTRKSTAVLEREIMTETERGLLKRDIMRVAEEYFETDGEAEADITRTENGFSVCILLRARRIKKIWSPQ
jgi:hypothetical protein